MDVIKKAIVDWLREILIGGIISNLSGMFDSVNEKVGEAIVEVGKSPSAWNSSIFNMVQNLSETVMIPIAGVILAFVMTLELIQLVTDRNNLHDIDTWMFFKWSFKTAAAVLIVTNTWNIVMGIFDAAQSVVNSAGGVIVSDASIDISSVVADLETRLAEMELGPLFGLWFQSLFVGITMWALTICIFIIVYGRMIEIYLVTSIAPIPMATMMNREWGADGAKLSARSACTRLSGVPHHRLCRHLCRAGAEHRRRQRHQLCDLDVHGIYGAALLHAVQIQFPRQEHLPRTLKENIMAYVPVPKDLTAVKSKVFLNLTRRQLICFGGGALIGVPLFFLLKQHISTSAAALCMIFVMLPCFLLAMYEKQGLPLEKILRNMIRVYFIRPKHRPYETNNFYSALARQEKLDKEVQRIVYGKAAHRSRQAAD